MPDFLSKSCSGCKEPLVCKSDDIAACQCSDVKLSPETIEFLSRTFFDCLCKSCLEKVEREVTKAEKHEFPKRRGQFVEGLHYYKENGNWVFTELYHTLRGFCCQNRCRHCVYGFQ